MLDFPCGCSGCFSGSFFTSGLSTNSLSASFPAWTFFVEIDSPVIGSTIRMRRENSVRLIPCLIHQFSYAVSKLAYKIGFVSRIAFLTLIALFLKIHVPPSFLPKIRPFSAKSSNLLFRRSTWSGRSGDSLLFKSLVLLLSSSVQLLDRPTS